MGRPSSRSGAPRDHACGRRCAIAEEIRALRYVVAARLAQAIAGAEQGEDETPSA
jgi:hypothetical protein